MVYAFRGTQRKITAELKSNPLFAIRTLIIDQILKKQKSKLSAISSSHSSNMLEAATEETIP